MESVEPDQLSSASGDAPSQASLLLRDVRERLARLTEAAPEEIVVGVWTPCVGLCVVALGGEMDMSNAADLGRAIDGRVGHEPCHLVVELSALTFIDSTGIKEIVRIAKLINASGGTTALAAPSPHVARVLELVELGQVVEIEESLEAALARISDAADKNDDSETVRRP